MKTIYGNVALAASGAFSLRVPAAWCIGAYWMRVQAKQAMQCCQSMTSLQFANRAACTLLDADHS